MAALRRARTEGSVVALVVFILLFFLAAGSAIWLWHQLALTRKAVLENQQTFDNIVAAQFREENWTLPKAQDTQYGISYANESFLAVQKYLKKAAEYETLQDLLGWKSVKGVADVLQGSPAQAEKSAKGEPTYATIANLLDFYGRSYESMKRNIAGLKSEVTALKKVVEAKTSQITATERSLRDELSNANKRYLASITSLQQKYDQLLASYEEQKKQTEQWQDKYTQTVAQYKETVARLKEEGERWQELYRMSEAAAFPELQEAPEKEFGPEGKVRSIERSILAAVVDGGRDERRRKDEVLVVYDEDMEGRRMPKARLLVTKIFDHTSLASIIDENERIREGDLFLSESAWQKFEAAAQAAPATE